VSAAVRFLSVAGGRLEYVWHGPPPDAAPTLVFLHEGLGCVDLWRDFPRRVAAATGCGALVYSRFGYGRSDPCSLPRPLDYMHDEARRVLRELVAAARLRDFLLVGHSDGASIAIIYAGSAAAPGLKGLVLEAPHVFCEDLSVRSIAAAEVAYREGPLRRRLERYHGANVDLAFRGWNDAWLDPGFRHWNIEEFLAPLAVPLQVIQGEDDEYGTIEQVRAIVRQAGAGAEAVMLPACGHSPHRDQPEATLAAMTDFIGRVLARSDSES
jgi:pimeloyl-ACP methyl ester carboxylesterase